MSQFEILFSGGIIGAATLLHDLSRPRLSR